MTYRLFTPGPVMVPPEILKAASQQPMHHRSPEFIDLSQRVWSQLQRLFQTANPVVMLGGSGMSGIEAAMISSHKAGDHVAILDHGRFGARLTEIAEMHGLFAHRLETSWGRSISANDVLEFLSTRTDWSGLWFVHAETSTGVLLDAAQIIGSVKNLYPNVLIGVDCVTSIGIQPVLVDEWGIDLAIAGIQKGLMCPPGLACVSISEFAEHRILSNQRHSYTLDLRTILDHQRDGLFTWTPPVTLVAALEVALGRIFAEGLSDVWLRHATCANVLRTGVAQLGMKVFGDATSHAITVVEHHRSREIQRQLRDVHGIIVAGGQDRLAGKVIRIGTCGAVRPEDTVSVIEALHTVITNLAT